MEDKLSTCERGGDLVAVLYGEASEREQREFELHLKQCAGCRAEFAAFAQVRESVGEWRDEALSGFVSSRPAVAPVRKSALAAWRQFFDLSPLWMKAAVGFAAVVFCVLAVLAVGRLRSPAEVPPRVATGNPAAVYTEADVARMVQEALAKQPRQLTAEAPKQIVAESPQRKDLTVAKASQVPHSRRPFSQAERNQLAAELRLVSASEENDLESPDQ